MSDLPADVKSLFEAPFTFDGRTFIWDANSQMVADNDWSKPKADQEPRPRGWGHVQYLEDGASRMTKWGETFYDIIGKEKDMAVVADLLTEAWKKQGETEQ